jgi:hypothetical protein
LSSSSISSEEDFPEPMRKLRRKVIEELMETERDYVTLLQNLCQVKIAKKIFVQNFFRVSSSSADVEENFLQKKEYAKFLEISSKLLCCIANYLGS